MDDVGVGRLLRALRIRRGWRQSDVAARAAVSRTRVSLAERGMLEGIDLGELRRIGTALEVRVRLDASWRGGDADRLVNAAHVALQGRAATTLAGLGWVTVPEATFSIGAERGSIDVLGWREDRRSLLIVETKTELADPGALIAQVDRYRRLGRAVASERGWQPAAVGVWVIVAESTMNRNRHRHAASLLRAAFPDGIVAVRGWLREPDGHLAALTFSRYAAVGSTRHRMGAIRRVPSTRVRSAGAKKIPH